MGFNFKEQCWPFYEEWAEGLRVGIREWFASWEKKGLNWEKKTIEGSTGWLFLWVMVFGYFWVKDKSNATVIFRLNIFAPGGENLSNFQVFDLLRQ